MTIGPWWQQLWQQRRRRGSLELGLLLLLVLLLLLLLLLLEHGLAAIHWLRPWPPAPPLPIHPTIHSCQCSDSGSSSFPFPLLLIAPCLATIQNRMLRKVRELILVLIQQHQPISSISNWVRKDFNWGFVGILIGSVVRS